MICSRGEDVELDYDNGTVRLVPEFYHPETSVSGFEGITRICWAGSALFSWGTNPSFTENTTSGVLRCVLDV